MYLGHSTRRDLIYDISKSTIIADPAVILDMGSRHGEGFFELGLSCNCTYIFVEPSPRCTPYIQSVIESFPDRKFVFIDGILDEKPGMTEMYILENDHDQSGNLFSDRNKVYGDAKKAEVKVFGFDVIPFEKIDFAKINIEGGEYKLIEAPFFNKIEMFVMEVHNIHVPGKTFRNVIDALETRYDLTSYGNLAYKYCFISGVKIK